MKKLLLFAVAALVLSACSKNNDDSPNDVLKAKLIGEWEEYGYYWINKGSGNRPDDTTYYPNHEEIKYWTFTSSEVTRTNSWKNEPYNVKEDSIYIDNTSRHLQFIGDSCIMTTNWGGTHNHVKAITVLQPKGSNK